MSHLCLRTDIARGYLLCVGVVGGFSLFMSADSDVMPRLKRLCTTIGASNRSKSRLRSLESVFGALMIRVALEKLRQVVIKGRVLKAGGSTGHI